MLFFRASKKALEEAADIELPEPTASGSHDTASGGRGGKTWACPTCTFLNVRSQALMCAMCDAPRNLVEWAGFTKPVSKHKTKLQRLVKGFGICVKAAISLTKHRGAVHAFETGAVNIVTHCARSWDDLLGAFNHEAHGKNEDLGIKKVRVRAKRTLQDRLMKAHMASTGGGRLLSPDQFTHVLSACEVALSTVETLCGVEPIGTAGSKETTFLYGVVSRKNDYASTAPNNAPVPAPAVVCRAFHKVAEAEETSPLVAKCIAAAANKAGTSALDIGAAPGGWTAYLATKFERVVAIDSAELNADVLATEGVTHIKALLMKVEDGREGAAGREAYKDTLEKVKAALPGQPSLVCCDINQEPAEAAEIVLRTIPFIAPGTVFIITMKLTTRGKGGQRSQIADALKLLRPHCSTIEEHWFFNNTSRERTLVCEYQGIASPASFPPAPAPTAEEVAQVEASQQSGLSVVVVANDEDGVVDARELDRVFEECHHYGVAVVHVVNSRDPSLEEDCKRLSTRHVLEIHVHASPDLCLAALGAGTQSVGVATANSASAATLYDSAFVAAADGGEPKPRAVAIWATMGVAALPESVRQVTIPCHGLPSRVSTARGTGVVLAEVTRQWLGSA